MWRFGIVLALAVAATGRTTSAQATGGAPASESRTILVYPFETPEEADWIGRAAQEDLAAELARGSTAKIKSPFELKPPADLEAAVQRGRERRADYVVIGHAQSVDGYVRITAQVVDVAAERALGVVKITGPRNSLFDLEASLSRQVYSALPTNILKPDVIRSMGQPAPPSDFVQDPEPAPPLQIFAVENYTIPQRYEFAPIFVPVPVLVPYVPVVAATDYGPYAYPQAALGFFGTPFNNFGAFYDGYASAWYPAYNYPFGWLPYGGVTVVNNGFGGRSHGGFRHHPSALGWASATGARGLWNTSNGAPNGLGNAGGFVEFNFDGAPGAFNPGVPARGFAPAIPAGGFATGFSGVSPGFPAARRPRLGTISGPHGLSPGGFAGPGQRGGR